MVVGNMVHSVLLYSRSQGGGLYDILTELPLSGLFYGIQGVVEQEMHGNAWSYH